MTERGRCKIDERSPMEQRSLFSDGYNFLRLLFLAVTNSCMSPEKSFQKYCKRRKKSFEKVCKKRKTPLKKLRNRI